MSKGSNQSILVDNPEQQPLLHTEKSLDFEQEKCIIKVEHDVITDVQETKNNLFNCDIKSIAGKRGDIQRRPREDLW